MRKIQNVHYSTGKLYGLNKSIKENKTKEKHQNTTTPAKKVCAQGMHEYTSGLRRWRKGNQMSHMTPAWTLTHQPKHICDYGAM